LSLLEGDVVSDADSLRPVGGYLPVLRVLAMPDPEWLDTDDSTIQTRQPGGATG